jgi:hypothetical protein
MRRIGFSSLTSSGRECPGTFFRGAFGDMDMAGPKDGGPSLGGGGHNIYEGGMTLRQWYAGMALVGLCSGEAGMNPSVSVVDIANECNRIADAMLAARDGEK